MEKVKNKKKVEKIIKHIFIDTSVFEEENFFHGSKIQSLFNYGKTGIIQIHMTSISKLELLRRFAKQLDTCKKEMHRVFRSFNQKEIRIIKNLTIYKKFTIPIIEKDKHFEELKHLLETNIRESNINVIPTDGIKIDKIFLDYFTSKSPFGTGQKKDEFPDAFILGALEFWCISKKLKMIVLSKDKDFLSYKSENLILTDNTEELLAKISDYYDNEFSYKWTKIIKSSIEKNKDELTSFIEKEISTKIMVNTESNVYNTFSVESINLQKYNILSIRNDFSIVELLFSTLITSVDSPEIMDFSVNFFEENIKPKKLSITTEIPVDIEVEKSGKIHVKWINSGNDIIIEYQDNKN